MAEMETIKGLGAELRIEVDSLPFKRLLVGLGKTGIEVVEVDSLHITLIDPNDTVVPVISQRNPEAIESAQSKATEYLSEFFPEGDDKGLLFTPYSNVLMPYGDRRRKIGIQIAEQDLLNNLRLDIADIFYEEALIKLRSRREYIGHIVLGKKLEESEMMHEDYAPFRRNRHTIPSQLKASGFKITSKVKEASGEPAAVWRDDNRYRNKPKFLRRA